MILPGRVTTRCLAGSLRTNGSLLENKGAEDKIITPEREMLGLRARAGAPITFVLAYNLCKKKYYIGGDKV